MVIIKKDNFKNHIKKKVKKVKVIVLINLLLLFIFGKSLFTGLLQFLLLYCLTMMKNNENKYT